MRNYTELQRTAHYSLRMTMNSVSIERLHATMEMTQSTKDGGRVYRPHIPELNINASGLVTVQPGADELPSPLKERFFSEINAEAQFLQTIIHLYF